MDLLIESNEVLHRLIARLPELEWSISELGSLWIHNVPKGLFRFRSESTAASCIAEIKADIQVLSQQKNKRSALYLAERIRQKVNVLVGLCQIHKQKPKEKVSSFGIKMLSSRRQWIELIEEEINTLSEQQQAMTNTLERFTHHDPDSNALLHLKAELGEVERRLTLARETLESTYTI